MRKEIIDKLKMHPEGLHMARCAALINYSPGSLSQIAYLMESEGIITITQFGNTKVLRLKDPNYKMPEMEGHPDNKPIGDNYSNEPILCQKCNEIHERNFNCQAVRTPKEENEQPKSGDSGQ